MQNRVFSDMWITLYSSLNRMICNIISTRVSMLTFEGPSLIFFIWSLYFISSASILAIFLSIDSTLVSTYNGNTTQTASTTCLTCKHQSGCFTDVLRPRDIHTTVLTLPMQSERLGGGVCLLRPKIRFII